MRQSRIVFFIFERVIHCTVSKLKNIGGASNLTIDPEKTKRKDFY
jgi:hypothetical protein